MPNRQLIEANLAFLRRSTYQGTELEAFVAVMNWLQGELQLAAAAEQAALTPAPSKPNGEARPDPDPVT